MTPSTAGDGSTRRPLSAARIGVVGCGDVALQYLAAIANLPSPGAQIAAVCDLDSDRLDRAATQFGIAGRFSSLEELAGSGSVDAVLNLTPVRHHAAVTEAALTAGLHVFSEKPLATTLGEGEALRRLAGERGLALLCAPGVALTPLWQTARKVIADGSLGRTLAMRAHADAPPWPWPGFASDPSWYFEEDAGPLRDLGPYAIQLMTDLLGPAISIAGQSTRMITERVVVDGPRRGDTIPSPTQDAFSLSLRFSDGQLGTLDASYSVHASKAPAVEIYCEFGTVAFDLFAGDGPLDVCRVDGYEGEPTWGTVDLVGPQAAPPEGEAVEPWLASLRGLLGAGVAEFVSVLAAPRPSPLDAERACHALEIIDLAHRGSATSLQTSFAAPEACVPAQPAGGEKS